ncbi:MAG: DUF1009 domain-containing protein [Candidatus Omnitrophica bacterium]|nr:DUF1009 domain-containing protein [Candidatus Omnitrophota bacterium]
MTAKTKIGIIAGNRLLPVVLAAAIRRQCPECEIIALCFRGETSSRIKRFADRTHWLVPGHLARLIHLLKKYDLTRCILAGQISPLRIFQPRYWDRAFRELVDQIEDFRPHTVFSGLIHRLEQEGIVFLDSTEYLRDLLAHPGPMNKMIPDAHLQRDIVFGSRVAARYVELDIGQTLVVKNKTVAALESLEGTDRTLIRGARLAGRNCVAVKYSRKHQDLRFDVPVIGLRTLRVLRRMRAGACVLEAGRVIMLEKPKFLRAAARYGIPVVGTEAGAGDG